VRCAEGAVAQVSDVSLKRYEQELDPALVRELTRLLAPRMERWGYDAQFRPAGPRRWWLELATRHAVLKARRDWAD
jgi:hypothetical protein